MRSVSLRRDKYRGWQVSVDGCPNPVKRFRMMYSGERRHGWDRRCSAAAATHVVFGTDRARRYLVRRCWAPCGRGSV